MQPSVTIAFKRSRRSLSGAQCQGSAGTRDTAGFFSETKQTKEHTFGGISIHRGFPVFPSFLTWAHASDETELVVEA